MAMNVRRTIIGGIVAGLLAGAASVAGAVTIGQVLADPATYDGQSVTISGTVLVAIPVGSESGYDLQDGSGKISVVSRTGPPANGPLSITGTVHAVPDDEALSGQLPPFIVETSRLP
jgi:hypothetical protein